MQKFNNEYETKIQEALFIIREEKRLEAECKEKRLEAEREGKRLEAEREKNVWKRNGSLKRSVWKLNVNGNTN